MAIVEILSDSSSFEANVFAISQAQRFLVLCIMNDANRPEWAEDLAEDLSYSSWNNLYKSFGLLADDGYFAKGYGQSFIWCAAVLRSAIAAIDRITYDDF